MLLGLNSSQQPRSTGVIQRLEPVFLKPSKPDSVGSTKMKSEIKFLTGDLKASVELQDLKQAVGQQRGKQGSRTLEL